MPDPYEGIDFEEISEATGLAVDEIKCLKVCFDLFDTKKQDFLSADDLGEIMRAMGFRPTEEELKDLLKEIDEDGSGEIEIGEFCQLCATFLVEDPDMETMKRELKDAFRIYDKEGQGFITTETLRGLITELLAPLTNEEVEEMIREALHGPDDEEVRRHMAMRVFAKGQDRPGLALTRTLGAGDGSGVGSAWAIVCRSLVQRGIGFLAQPSAAKAHGNRMG